MEQLNKGLSQNLRIILERIHHAVRGGTEKRFRVSMVSFPCSATRNHISIAITTQAILLYGVRGTLANR